MPKMVGLKNKSRDRRGGFASYKGIDPTHLKKRAERSGGNFESIYKQGTNMFRPAQGDNNFRILPPTWEDPQHFGYTIWVHSWVGADNSTYLCPQKMLNKRCPICAASAEAAAAGEQDEAKNLKAKERVVYYVLDRDEDDNIPRIYDVSWSLDKEIVNQAEDKKTHQWLPIENPNVGYDVFMRRTGVKLNTRYTGVQIDRSPSPLSDSQKIMDKIDEHITANPIPSLLVFRSAEFLERVVKLTDEPEDELDDEETERDVEAEAEEEEREAKAHKRHAAKKKKAARDEDDDEEESEADEEDTDEVEEDETSETEDEAAEDEPEDDEEEDTDEDEEEEEDDGGEGDEDEDDAPPPRSKRGGREERVSAKRNGRGHDEDDDDEDEAPRSVRRVPRKVKRARR